MRKMLSEKEKQAIRAEEIYRNEVRQEIKEKSARNKKGVLEFLDTQHGTFIASMVVLPVLIWFFTFFQTKYTTYSEEQKLITRIDNEIVYRISNFKGRLVSNDVTGFVADIDSNSVYPEFAGVGVQGLMLQLESLVCNSQRSEISAARKSLISKNKSKIEAGLRVRGWDK